MTDPESVAKMLREVGGTAQLKSQAMRPFAWIVAILAPTTAIVFFSESVGGKIVFGTLLSLAVLTFIAGLIYLLVKDPDRLGTEAFIVQKEVIAFTFSTKGRDAIPEAIERAEDTYALPEPKDH